MMITRIQANKIYDCIGIYSTKDWHESTDRTGFHTEKGKVKDQYCWDYHTQCPAHMTNTWVMIWSVCLVINGMTMMIFRGGKTCPAGHNPVSLQGPPCHSLKTVNCSLHYLQWNGFCAFCRPMYNRQGAGTQALLKSRKLQVLFCTRAHNELH